jgi:hypothetical protein
MEIKRIFLVVLICALLLMFPLPAVGEQLAAPPDSRSAPVEEWNQTFGGSDYEWGNSVAETSDGGYIVAGTTYSYGAGNGDVWLIKTDASGVEEWNQTFGGSAVEYGDSVAVTSDGGYIITGSTQSYGAGHSDVWLIKTDAHGSKEWDQTFGGSGEDHGNSLAETSDGGYIIVASTQSYGAGSSDVWLIKTDAAGNEEWNELFGGSEWDFGYSVAQTSDNGYIIAGYTESYGAGSSDAWLTKTDAHGNEEWNELFGGSEWDYGYSVAETSDGGYIITGFSQSYGDGSANVWLIKTNAAGNEEWNEIFGGSSGDYGYSVAQTPDGGYIVTGYTYSYGAGSADAWLIKTDASGVEEWNQTFGGTGFDGGYSIAVTSDSGYIVAGESASYGDGSADVWLIKLSDSGTSVTPGDGNGDGVVNALDITKVERVIVALDTETPGADANGDGNINAMDITMVEMIIAGVD